MAINVEAARAAIPALKSVVYLNTGWSGPSPTSVYEAIADWMKLEAEHGPTSPPVMTQAKHIMEDARVAIAGVCGADPDEIALVENTTEGINIVLNGIAWRYSDEIVTCSLEHPSGFVPLYHLRDAKGPKIRIVPLDPHQSAESMAQAIAGAFTSHTRLVVLSGISFSTGARLPINRIVELAHAAGAEVLVDGAQTSGQIVLDMHASGVDYYAFTGHKWMLGPDGAGALYVRRDRIPALDSWKLYMPAAESFDTLGNWKPKRATIKKYELTTSSPALWRGYIEAIRWHQEIGPAAIEERTRALGQSLRARLARIPGMELVSPADGDTACGLVAFRVDGRKNAEVVDGLWERSRIVCRSVSIPPPGVVRAACHHFTTEAELDLFAEGVEALR